ncbi:MAG: M28 family peptidase [Planctomycetes bacterium]|nr:M28 family peptidase [Planctomycetota bacterium]
MTSPEHLRRHILPMTLPAVLILGLAGFASSQSTTKSPPTGRVVEAPANIISFAPTEKVAHVDAHTINLREVLEDLGPEAMLWYQHVQTLADPFFEGRVPNTRGAEIAGEYIAFYLASYGLEPAFPEENGRDTSWTSYFQPFEFASRAGPRIARVKDPHLTINDHVLEYGEDFVIFGNSGSGEVSAPLTFVGYGIEEGKDGYSSFDDETDLDERIALVLRGEPLDEEGHSRWSEKGFTRHASIRRKVRTLQDRGAVGIIFITPPGAMDSRSGLDDLKRSSQYGRSAGIPVAQLDPDIADDLLIQSDPATRTLETLRKLADRGDVTCVELDDDFVISLGAKVSRNPNRTMIPARNCGGVLPGRGELADEWLIIGGHHDHVGIGQLQGVMPANKGRLHPGADDNASGTAAVLVLAKVLGDSYAAAPADADLRSILFLTFDAEEQGLFGSRHYADHPTIDLGKITAMMNFDMVGRLRNDNVMILGAQTADGLEDLLTRHIENSGLTAALSPASSGRSDEANFIAREVPALHFFTGMHPEYTTPQDKWHTVNPGGAAKIIALATDIALDLATRPDQLIFTEPGQQRTQSRNYAKVRLGIRPGMGNDLDTGILVEGVSLDTSAADAGIIEGDILLSWDGEPLETTRDLFTVLQNHKPGDVVKIKLLRDGNEITLDVTLKASE